MELDEVFCLFSEDEKSDILSALNNYSNFLLEKGDVSHRFRVISLSLKLHKLWK